MPKEWTSYRIHYRFRDTVYHISITRLPDNSLELRQVLLDGQALSEPVVPLVDDRRDHSVEVKI
jgi:cellobiose phosphorylase